MEQVKRNKTTFCRLINENRGIIHKIAMVYTNTPDDRNDLFQAICLQLWKSFGNFNEQSEFSTWLYRVALNTAISDIRKKKRRIKYEPLRDIDKPQENQDVNRDRLRIMRRAITMLNRIDKALILLWLEEKSYEEIAQIVGMTTKNVSVRLVRIKKKLTGMVKSTINPEL